ncbi:Glyoxalase superfamily enzyme, possibly 3-demethylubiquinone-9 3-methyltransferase [Carnobacterium alterfunditum]|uniref:Glyoxalase superfamily enzyme, possibly 3-demethylubiquinone-9 3-methyltransferase n=1 Tax=Carnobacterium alterfunditum TaxID=28230 RepID=A0A1N6HFM0_9LACT|nr:VOC family protein [Carnobacterium alterfunditum]SIO18537.1 Glyoxalase superfamily enzyme, possibly 3-demethylubiquinone-9 3-methyltransferase [Carnobacterium alterfunditum]
MQKIIPHFWFDQEAIKAAEFYSSLFDIHSLNTHVTIYDIPSGAAETVKFILAGQSFMAISAESSFKFTPAVSFQVFCDTAKEAEYLWKELSDGGNILMPLGANAFSDKYGWTEDKYGLSWQILYLPNQFITQKIVPTLLFSDEQCGKAKEAMTFYTSVFFNSTIDVLHYYGEDDEQNQAGTVMYGLFELEGLFFVAMDGGAAHDFTFNEAISFMIYCDTQEEIDHYWEKLSTVPESEHYGWLKDKYGVSWQIIPTIIKDMMATKNPEQLKRVTEAFLKMKKLDIAELKRIYEG